MVKRGLCTVLWLALFGASRASAQMAEEPRSADPAADASPPREEAGEATVDDRDAKRAFEEGVQLLREERWERAEEAFRRSLATVPKDSAKYDLAYVLFKRGRIRQSLAVLKELLDRPPSSGDPRYREYAAALMPHVVAELATLHLRTSASGATLSIDDEVVAGSGSERDVPIDPGQHVVVVSLPDFADERFAFSVAPGARVERTAVFARARTASGSAGDGKRLDRTSSASSPLHSIGPWLTIGLGGALLVGGAISGFLARRADDDFVGRCPTLRNCDPSLRDTQDRAVTLGHVSDALLISGAVVGSGGIVWKVLAPSPAPRSTNDSAFAITVSGVY